MSAADSAPALQAEGVNKSFGAISAAQDINVSVPPRAVWSLIGANGAGKTTFINIVTGYIKPDSGKILFEGHDVTALSPRQITRAGICRSFQIPQLCAGLTVLQNILIAQTISAEQKPSLRRRADDPQAIEQAMALLRRFRIEDQHDRLIGELSAGVRKLLDIAMSISGRPRLMLLDEPTSGVAAEEKFPLMDLVLDALAAEQVTVLFVEHDMDIVTRYAQRVLAFYDGRVIANDAPADVLADPEVQRYVTGTAK